MDESGFSDSLQREYARARRGSLVISSIKGKKNKRTSVIAAYVSATKTLLAPYAFVGYTDTQRFNGWVETCLLPELRPGQTVVMDNAPFHKSQKTKNLIESVGCRLLYQPKYSPDLNPIEKVWGNLKRKYRKIIRRHNINHYDAINALFQYD
jgi:hypothetical protein